MEQLSCAFTQNGRIAGLESNLVISINEKKLFTDVLRNNYSNDLVKFPGKLVCLEQF